MKRSEVIKKMVDCYRTCKVMRYSNDQAMDRVLELLEEQGIRPPPREKTEEEMKNPTYDLINLHRYTYKWTDET